MNALIVHNNIYIRSDGTDNSTSSVLTPIDNNIIRTHAIEKSKGIKETGEHYFTVGSMILISVDPSMQ